VSMTYERGADHTSTNNRMRRVLLKFHWKSAWTLMAECVCLSLSAAILKASAYSVKQR
jgi:hypothetical protein